MDQELINKKVCVSKNDLLIVNNIFMYVIVCYNVLNSFMIYLHFYVIIFVSLLLFKYLFISEKFTLQSISCHLSL